MEYNCKYCSVAFEKDEGVVLKFTIAKQEPFEIITSPVCNQCLDRVKKEMDRMKKTTQSGCVEEYKNLNIWNRFGDTPPKYNKRVLVYRRATSRYIVLYLKSHNFRDCWSREGGALQNIDNDDMWMNFNLCVEKQEYQRAKK